MLIFPIFLLGIAYIITDPNKKIWVYKTYRCDYIMLNRGDVSTRTYLKNRNIYFYDSFIFGSSRSCSHMATEWKKYLPENNSAFSYGSWNETIKGIYRKINLIDSLNGYIKNAFVIIDSDRTFVNYSYDPVITDHYLISGISRFEYYKNDFFSYIHDPILIITSIDYSLFHKKRSYMKGFIGMKKEDLDPITNDWFPNSEKEILKNENGYYQNCKNDFYLRSFSQEYCERQIDQEELNYLFKIRSLFQKHMSNFKIIIAPLYDQIKMNTEDINLLISIFGEENTYDFSGINEITDNITNYNHDIIHYRKKAGNLIYSKIYPQDRKEQETDLHFIVAGKE